ncbi:hypothetical protein HMPREF0168_1291 [Bifidobacterium dentium ATCC 27679]|uniref:Uncharacterized protein n=2 Tax=Bifidobacterium dentium TaxID=1689 RepID=E0Q833_9BIFI|nr:hypothetical protein HMPREF0168_1291 [Bifidobacterium dentium ATCC 27679]EFO77132.1 hypothetical protein HMPREF9003_0687 [Bifidobacterium dentium JCVIHMP022]
MPPSLAMCQRSRMAQRPNYSSLWVNHLARKPLRVPKYPVTGTITPPNDLATSRNIQTLEQSPLRMTSQHPETSRHWNNHPVHRLLSVPNHPTCG